MNKTLDSSSPNTMFNNFFWRFTFLFLVIFVFPHDIGYGVLDIPPFMESLWDIPVIWFGETFFDWEFNIDNLIRGFDSKFEFCKNILSTVLAIIGSFIWVFIDTRLKNSYNHKFKIFVLTILRYHIAILLVQYGLAKIFPIQFGSIGISTMDLTIGEQSPMWLMWNFLSYSKTMAVFSGLVEIIGALLLLFRRTTFLGAILLFSVMANVVLMDIGYNVNVTLYAIQLFLYIVVLLSPQLKSLYTLIVCNKPSVPESYQSLFKNTRFYKISLVFKVVLILLVGYLITDSTRETHKLYVHNTTSWFTSKHTPHLFVINNDTLNINSSKDPKIWKEFVFNGYSYYPDSFEIIHNDTLKNRYKFKIDSIAKTIDYTLFFEKDENWKTITYQKIGDREYVFEGVFDKDTLHIMTKAKMPEDYKLMQQKGRWLLDL